jgi:hypothetical protein
MNLTIHFAHWWIYVLVGIGGFVVGSIVIVVLISLAGRAAIGRGLGW